MRLLNQASVSFTKKVMTKKNQLILFISLLLFFIPEILWNASTDTLIEIINSLFHLKIQLGLSSMVAYFDSINVMRAIIVVQLLGIMAATIIWIKDRSIKLSIKLPVGLLLAAITVVAIYSTLLAFLLGPWSIG